MVDNSISQERRWKSMQLILFEEVPLSLKYSETEEGKISFEEKDQKQALNDPITLHDDTSMGGDYSFLNDDTLSTQDPDETIRAASFPPTNALELTSFLVQGGITMKQTRNTIKRMVKPRAQLLSVEPDLDHSLSIQLNSSQINSSTDIKKTTSL
jgi:hypothetical protein